MNELSIYLLKVALAIALLSLPYYLFLRNDSLLVVKRLYLAGGVVLAWIFPLLAVSKPELTQAFEPVFFIDPGTPSEASGTASLPESTARQISTITLFGLVYLTGIILLFLKNISSYLKTKSGRISDPSGNKDVIFTNKGQVFTIFPKIFIPKKYAIDTGLDSILIHERAHIKQLHFLDLLLAEVTLLLTWFNPFSWLISRMIKENHEHLADRAVLLQGVNPAHYKALLLNHAMGGEVFRLGHQFNHSLTKKRFNMMKKIKAPKKGFLKYIVIVPVILGFTLIATAASVQKSKTIKGTVYLETKGEPATGASVVIANSTIGTVVDRDGTFSLEVQGNPEVVISFVGYGTVRKSAKEITAKPIILKPVSIIYTLEDPAPDKFGKEKIKISKGTKDAKEPLYILDGEVVSSIENIDPEQIEKVEVIKDPSDPIFKKYNSDSGIVLITSKKEKPRQVEQADEPVFYVVEDMPSFKGGMDALSTYLKEHIKYPLNKNGDKITGEVMVQFRVTAKGLIDNVEIKKSSNKELNDIAMEVIKNMPEWNPGKQRGKAVNVNIIVPVRFNTSQE